ncbi:MAG: 1-phosphofructokinase family hexose kinase [Gemmobacter sp.]
MIVTVTLNPALDVSGRTDRVVPGPKLRLRDVVTEPGGGGLNVARAVRALGGQAQALAVLGGATGGQVAALLAAEGVPLVPLSGAGETRQSLSVTDGAGAQWRFVLPGPPAPEAAVLVAAIAAAAPPGALVVLSGSQPPGLADGFAPALAAALPGRRLVVDTSGPALAACIDGRGLHTLRMDRAEAEAAAGHALPQAQDTGEFCGALVARGVAEVAIAARGAEGNILASAEGVWLCTPPLVEVVSAVGAGDSFAAGYVLALERGADLPQALRAGTAAAAAAVTTPGTALCRRADAEALAPQCRLTRL